MLTPVQRQISAGSPGSDPEALYSYMHHLAYSGRHRDVFRLFLRLTRDQRERLAEDTCTASSVVVGAAQQLDPAQGNLLEHVEGQLTGLTLRLQGAQQSDATETNVVELVENHLAASVGKCREQRHVPLELFHALEAWANCLGAAALHRERVKFLSQAFQLGIEKYPSTQLHFALLLARTYLEIGEAKKAMNLVRPYIAKPYRVTSRSGLDVALHTASQAALAIPEIDSFALMSWSALRSFATDSASKMAVARQLSKFYRGIIRLLLARESGATLFAKMIALLALFERALRNSRLTRWLGHPARLVIVVLLYLHNYSRPNRIKHLPPPDRSSDASAPAAAHRRKAHILITRAMGGIGDLLMMTPGFGVLKAANPDREIHLAIPRGFFPVFQGNEDVVLKDIENDLFDPRDYAAWYNLSDCPASRVESRTAPRVRKNRIDIFAKAIGVSARELDRFGRTPRYFVSGEERRLAEELLAQTGLSGKTLVGVHPYSAERYRDFPHFEQLVGLLAQFHHVLVFHNTQIKGFDLPNVTKIDHYSLRQSVALLQRCAVLVAPDSSLVHVAAALGLPTLAIFGPTDGKIRTRDYRCVEALDLRPTMRCIPCWRHEYSPCLVSGSRTSVCVHAIDAHQVLQRVLSKLTASNQRPLQM